MRRRLSMVAAVSVAALALLGGCTVSSSDGVVERAGASSGTSSSPRSEDVPEQLRPYYEQRLSWTECKDHGERQCAEAEVPLNWDKPKGKRITVALARITAGEPSKRIGSLLVNPGGPGGSGIDLLDSVPQRFSSSVRDAYDVVGFDPRGVGKSSAVKCLGDKATDDFRAKVYPDGPEGVDEMTADAKKLGEKCLAETGDLLGHVDTGSAARDMDVLRAVLGDEKLNYLGYSYGTQLGGEYADLFPEKVGRLVLDGAVDTALDADTAGQEQMAAFEKALRAYVADCQSSKKCPLTGTVDDGLAQINALLQKIKAKPLPSKDGRKVTLRLALSGLVLPLYADESWFALTAALDAAINDNDGSMLLALADLGADRESDGTYSSNSTFAFTAISCLDSPVDASPEGMEADAEALRIASPTLGEFMDHGAISCANWPEKPVGKPKGFTATGAAPILVIGTTGDPATPIEWAQRFADRMKSAVLVTWEGQGHTAYGRGNKCIAKAVDEYLLKGKVPTDGSLCADKIR